MDQYALFVRKDFVARAKFQGCLILLLFRVSCINSLAGETACVLE